MATKIDRRLFALDQEVANGRIFRALLEDLNARDPVKGPHIAAVAAVRAGILRALISSVFACLDRKGEDRASVGQILRLIEDAEAVAVFKTGTAALQRVKDEYENLVESELFKLGRSLRNKAIAHLLTTNASKTPTEYKDIYALHDAVEQLTIDLFELCGCDKPTFLYHRANSEEHAKIFWDTYFAGMRCR
jgi:hypothetical protein